MMKLLAIDTVTEACSVGLMIDDEIRERFEIIPQKHTRRVLPMVDELLGEAGLTVQQLDGLVLDRGPGSFTGLRIATSVVQGLAFAANLPVVPISSLAAIAQAGWQEYELQQVLAVMDARMGEVYWGFYTLQEGVMRLQGREQVSDAEQIEMQTGEWTILGTGCDIYMEKLSGLANINRILSDTVIYPRARYLLQLAVQEWHSGNRVAAHEAQPVYLRDNVAHKATR